MLITHTIHCSYQCLLLILLLSTDAYHLIKQYVVMLPLPAPSLLFTKYRQYYFLLTATSITHIASSAYCHIQATYCHFHYYLLALSATRNATTSFYCTWHHLLLTNITCSQGCCLQLRDYRLQCYYQSCLLIQWKLLPNLLYSNFSNNKPINNMPIIITTKSHKQNQRIPSCHISYQRYH